MCDCAGRTGATFLKGKASCVSVSFQEAYSAGSNVIGSKKIHDSDTQEGVSMCDCAGRTGATFLKGKASCVSVPSKKLTPPE